MIEFDVKSPVLMTHVGCLAFCRMKSGNVIVLVTDGRRPDEGGVIQSAHLITDGIWCSIALDMTAFGERPNDWQELMDHHHGRFDVIGLAKQYRLEKAIEARKENEAD